MQKKSFPPLLAILLLLGVLLPSLAKPASAKPADKPLQAEVSPYDLIAMMNALRVAHGLSPLIEDPIINAVAQETAQIMADTNATWHIGNPSGRIQAAGFGGGGQVYATENFAMGGNQSLDNIMVIWSDPDHMRPATGPYCNVGAGVATSAGGVTYYILQAAYVSGRSCGSYTSAGTTNPVTGSTVDKTTGISLIVPVTVAKPNADGDLIHEVKYGQSLWLIAVAYKTTVNEIRIWNNLPEDYKLQVDEKLVIPWEGAKGYKTPTPVGMILTSTPDANGDIVHIVEAYQTLERIASAYGVSVDKILQLNHWSVSWPLQIGQSLQITGELPTPTPTQRPLSPLEKLTLAPDGNYYHTVREGWNLTLIANLYGITVEDLILWNPAYANTGLMPGDQLLLHVTPPATATFTPLPPTATLLPSATPTEAPTATPSPSASPTVKNSPTLSPTASPSPTPQKTNPFVVGGVNFLWFVPVFLLVIGAVEFMRARKSKTEN